MDDKYPIVCPDGPRDIEIEKELPTQLDKDPTGVQRKGHPKFYKLLEEMADLHSRKNANYTAGQDHFSNIRESERFGIPAWKGTLIRMGDKWNRLMSMANGSKDMVNESTKDTLMDMAVYSLICIILLEEKEKNN